MLAASWMAYAMSKGNGKPITNVSVSFKVPSLPKKSGSDAAFWWGIERTRARMRFAAACASTWQRKEQEQQIVLDSTISSRFTIQCCWQLGDIQGAI
jgi:hypothetical protein